MDREYTIEISRSTCSLEKFRMLYQDSYSENGTIYIANLEDRSASGAIIWINGRIFSGVYGMNNVERSKDGLMTMQSYMEHNIILVNKRGEVLINTNDADKLIEELLNMEFYGENTEIVVDKDRLFTRNLEFTIRDTTFAGDILGRYKAIQERNTWFVGTIIYDKIEKRWIPNTYGAGHRYLSLDNSYYEKLKSESKEQRLLEQISSKSIHKRIKASGLDKYICISSSKGSSLFDSSKDFVESTDKYSYCVTIDGVYVLAALEKRNKYGILRYSKEDGRLIQVIPHEYEGYKIQEVDKGLYITLENKDKAIRLKLQTEDEVREYDVVEMQGDDGKWIY